MSGVYTTDNSWMEEVDFSDEEQRCKALDARDEESFNGMLGIRFASPIMCGMVACLWQACPELTAKEVIELVRRSGDRTDYPDNIYGYGVPDMWKAYQDYQSERNK